MLDGKNEEISFSCLNDEEIEEDERSAIKEHWFSNAFWECYNGDFTDENSIAPSEKTCKPYGQWKKDAVHSCNEKCKKIKTEDGELKLKCGVSSFAVSNECYPQDDSLFTNRIAAISHI